MMPKKILFIDDNNISHVLAKIKMKILDENGFQAELSLFNPGDKKFEGKGKEIDFEKVLDALKKDFLDERLDLVACDYNLHSENKKLAFQIIQHIRKFNKVCTIFVYSGGITKALLQDFSTSGNEGERLTRAVLSSNIAGFYNGRGGALENAVVDLIARPSLELQVETFLLQHPDFKMEHGYKTFAKYPLRVIAKEVRLQTSKGKSYTREIIERGLSHMIDLNS